MGLGLRLAIGFGLPTNVFRYGGVALVDVCRALWVFICCFGGFGLRLGCCGFSFACRVLLCCVISVLLVRVCFVYCFIYDLWFVVLLLCYLCWACWMCAFRVGACVFLLFVLMLGVGLTCFGVTLCVGYVGVVCVVLLACFALFGWMRFGGSVIETRGCYCLFVRLLGWV